MPLRDHFRPPLSKRKPWEALHGGWPMEISKLLNANLPPEFEAEPRVHLGSAFEIDVSAYENDRRDSPSTGELAENGGVATATWSPGKPILLLEADAPTESEYEVLVYNVEIERRLVAAIEIVSPGNKDRPDSRRLFVNKCEALLRKDVCVVIVDLVTIRTANLYGELADLIGAPKPVAARAPIYAVSCRPGRSGDRWRVEAWGHELVIGQELPTLPLWLSEALFVPLELEASYEEACRGVRIR